LLLPIALLPLALLTLGLSWFLASLGVYLRDVGQVIGIATTALLFLSPVFYPLSVLPEKYQTLLLFNPLAPTIEQVRDVLIWGRMPDWLFFGASFAASAIIAWLGFAWFQKTRKGFADVL
jgi:lipopolysaccharide transport system permease protein